MLIRMYQMSILRLMIQVTTIDSMTITPKIRMKINQQDIITQEAKEFAKHQTVTFLDT